MSKKTNPIALLIDGDNVPPSLVPLLLDEVSKYGNPIIREVFINKKSLDSWDPCVNEFSLNPHYVPNNTKGKNAADIALVIRALQLFYEREDLKHFCIVSSDSDFTGLAKHIVAGGKYLLGVGEEKTPESFRKACSQFIYAEDLQAKEVIAEKPNEISNPDKEDVSPPSPSFEPSFIAAYEASPKDEQGWVPLLEIKTRTPNFVENYKNTRQLADKVKSVAASYPSGILEVDERSEVKPVTHYVRIADCDVFKFIAAYKHAPVKVKDRWVRLSTIGAELKNYSSSENGFTYRGRSVLSAIVKAIQNDYPGLIETKEERDNNSVIHLVRVKL